LRAGRAVAFVSDQDARGTGVFVPFFGRLASTHRGPALMAIRTGAPLFVGYAMRAADGSYVGGIEEITVSREGDMDEAVLRLTAAFTARLEALIRRAPEQYFWQHRRWKTRPPEETLEGVNTL
jgi:Kdo2-lipid IVA lauroyltransferase/acyltransferase